MKIAWGKGGEDQSSFGAAGKSKTEEAWRLGKEQHLHFQPFYALFAKNR